MTAPIRRAVASPLSGRPLGWNAPRPLHHVVAADHAEQSKWRACPSPPDRQEAQLSEINWAAELRKIEREYDGLPPEPSPTELRQKRDVERQERERQDAAAASFGVYFRLTLLLGLAVSIAAWPFDINCGATLLGYMAAVALLVVSGIWTAAATFTHQLPRRHLTVLLVICWGIVLGAAQVLPRIGYANPVPGRATTWSCTAN